MDKQWTRKHDLGTGAFGRVVLFVENNSNEKLAVKILTKTDDRAKNRWNEERDKLSRLDHPNVVKSLVVPAEIKRQLREENVVCMEYCELGNLRRYFREKTAGRRMNEQEVIDLTNDIGKALSYLHEQDVAHRDIKPENIVLKDADTPSKRLFKLVDFGFVKDIGESIAYHSRVGTQRYLPPQIPEGKPYSKRVDYWSYGCVVFESITGSVPFNENTLQKAKTKENHHICFFRDEYKTNIERKVFPNFCSDWTIRSLEKVLKLLLRYDDRIRGGLKKGNSFEWFNELQTLSSCKRVHVHDFSSNVEYSFGFHPSTNISLILNEIANKIVGKYIIIDNNGKTVDGSKDFYHYFESETIKVCDWFVVRLKVRRMELSLPELPNILLRVCKKPKAGRMFQDIIDACLEAVCYTSNLARLLKIHCTGVISLRKFLLNKLETVNQSSIELGNNMQTVKGLWNFYENSFNIDIRYCSEELRLSHETELEEMKEEWMRRFQKIKKSYLDLSEKNNAFNAQKQKLKGDFEKLCMSRKCSNVIDEGKTEPFIMGCKDLYSNLKNQKDQNFIPNGIEVERVVSKAVEYISTKIKELLQLYWKMIDLGTEIDHVIEFYETLSYMNISLNRDCLNDQENRQKFLWKRKKINYIKDPDISSFYRSFSEGSNSHVSLALEEVETVEREFESLKSEIDMDSLKPKSNWDFLYS